MVHALSIPLYTPQGIPIIYYGTEQGFQGPKDPNNRESLWPHYDTTTVLFMAISNMTRFRSRIGSSLYSAAQVERYSDDEFFAFTRGDVFVAVTNIGSGGSLTRTITYHPYSEGTSKYRSRICVCVRVCVDVCVPSCVLM